MSACIVTHCVPEFAVGHMPARTQCTCAVIDAVEPAILIFNICASFLFIREPNKDSPPRTNRGVLAEVGGYHAERAAYAERSVLIPTLCSCAGQMPKARKEKCPVTQGVSLWRDGR
ncbi:hypothetical protein J1614_008137 [Plenodomus biglobosus]|nr:hypothetical protein J1614_008137 [Plenodomus biglobosus]